MVLEMAKDLGVDLVKVFAAWPGLINDEEELHYMASLKEEIIINVYGQLNSADGIIV